MELALFILTVISTIATVLSTIVAVRAKNQCKGYMNIIKNLKVNISNSEDANVKTGKVNVTNTGFNEGIISGVVSGEVKQNVGK